MTEAAEEDGNEADPSAAAEIAAILAAREADYSDEAELTEWAEGYWSAWHRLTHDRQLGAMGGAGRIPWSSIDSYADKNGFDADLLSRMMWAMDDVFLEWLGEQQKKSPDNQ